LLVPVPVCPGKLVKLLPEVGKVDPGIVVKELEPPFAELPFPPQ
jgi:hypothetical protein